MRVSVVIATRNRSNAIVSCLEAIATAAIAAMPVEIEIVVVDNGCVDDKMSHVASWSKDSPIPFTVVFEPLPGLSRAQNAALRVARGRVIAFTDDDCCWSPTYLVDLLRYDEQDHGLVLRGGRVDLGDQSDLPLTIQTHSQTERWSRRGRGTRKDFHGGWINGCNMVMRRSLLDRIGVFDEDFGTGSLNEAAGDTDLLYRAYIAGALLEYVPDMAVRHFHGRKSVEDGQRLIARYMRANGALWVRYLFRYPPLCRPFLWDCRNALLEVFRGTNTFFPAIGFSHRDKVLCSLQGASNFVVRELKRRLGSTAVARAVGRTRQASIKAAAKPTDR